MLPLNNTARKEWIRKFLNRISFARLRKQAINSPSDLSSVRLLSPKFKTWTTLIRSATPAATTGKA
jgi:hypothetical protein